MEKGKEVFCALKRLIMAVIVRNRDLSDCCPSFVLDEAEEAEKRKRLAKSQKDVDDAIQRVRAVTDGRLKEYSDAEIAILAHMLCGIWSGESSLSVDSRSVGEIVGNNRAEDAGELVLALLSRKSPLFRFVSIVWEDSRRRVGSYAFGIHNPEGLHKLFLGNAIAQE